MNGDIQFPLNFESVHRELYSLGIELTRLPGEYRINFRRGKDETALHAEDLERALSAGRAMAAEAAAAPAPSIKRKKKGLTFAAVRRRQIRAHNHRVHGRLLKKARKEKPK